MKSKSPQKARGQYRGRKAGGQLGDKPMGHSGTASHERPDESESKAWQNIPMDWWSQQYVSHLGFRQAMIIRKVPWLPQLLEQSRLG